LFLYTVEISAYSIIRLCNSWWNLFVMCLMSCCIDVCLLVFTKYELCAVWKDGFLYFKSLCIHAIPKISRSYFLLRVSM